MTNESKVEVELSVEQRGIKVNLRAQVDAQKSEETLANFIKTIKNQNEELNTLQGSPTEAPYEASPTQEISPKIITASEEPFANMANDLGVSVDQLKNARIIGFKPGIDKPQLIGWAKFNSPEIGATIILYAFEIGLGKHSVSYDVANEVFMQCNYKVGPLSNRALQNLKNQNKIDANRYQKSKELTLSPSGLEFARKELKKALGIA